MSNMKILYFSNIPSPYRVIFFNELSKYYELTVVYERDKADDRDINWKEFDNGSYSVQFLPGIKYKSEYIISTSIKKYLEKTDYDYVVFCNYASVTGIIGINYCIRHYIKYLIESDGAFYTRKPLKNIIKRKLLRHAFLCLSTCHNLDDYYKKLGVKQDKIFRYHFSSLTNKNVSDNSKEYNKRVIKNGFGIRYKKVFLYVGQFIYRKGLDILIESLSYLNDDVCLIVVGGVPTTWLTDLVKKYKLSNIFFYEFKTKKELDMFYRFADYFVLPTREDIWGLVINEALSYGLPVLTTDRCNAGLELIKEGYNGYIVKHNSVVALTEGLKKMLSNTESLRDNCLESIKNYTVENMVRDHMKVFDKYGKEKGSDH